MAFPASRPSPRARRALRYGLLLVACLVVAHDAVYVVRYGVGTAFTEAMAAGGRHVYWPAFAGLAAAAAALLGIAVVVRLALLWRQARGLPQPAAAPVASVPTYRREALRLWLALFPAVAAGYVILENAEHLVGHGHAVGLAPLFGSGVPVAVPVLAVVAGIAAAIGGLARWQVAALSARIEAARARRWLRASARSVFAPRWRITAALTATSRLLARSQAGRAPPAGLPT